MNEMRRVYGNIDRREALVALDQVAIIICRDYEWTKWKTLYTFCENWNKVHEGEEIIIKHDKREKALYIDGKRYSLPC